MGDSGTNLIGSIRVEGNAIGSALITGNGNIVTIVYANSAVLTARPVLATNPYRGLNAFDETSAQFFFGREQLVHSILTQLERLTAPPLLAGIRRFLAIVGPSGSGKTSVVRAGVLPALANATAAWLRNPSIAILTPGYSPLEALADALARLVTRTPNSTQQQKDFASLLRERAQQNLHDGLTEIVRKHVGSATPIVLLVDQFEEAYTLCRSVQGSAAGQIDLARTERDAFVATLLQATAEPNSSVSVLITLRSDFLGAIAEHPHLSGTVATSHQIVPALSREALERAVAEPARIAGHALDRPTIDRILNEASSEVGALPLVQFALERIWDRLRDGVSPGDTLVSLGGVGGALAARANEVFTSLSKEDQTLAQRAFLGTVQLGDGAARDTRRRAWLDEFAAAGSGRQELRAAIEPFIKERLLAIGSTDDGRLWIELPHEALIRYWKEFGTWVDTHREDLRFGRQVLAAAEAWDRANRPAGSLWRRPDLDLLQRFALRNKGELNELQFAFLAASERQASIEWWFLRGAVAAIGILAIIAGAFGWIASRQRQMAESAQYVATDRLIRLQTDNGMELLNSGDLTGSLPWLVESLTQLQRQSVDHDVERQRIASILESSPTLLRVWFKDSKRVFNGVTAAFDVSDAVFSPDETRVLIVSNDAATLYDVATGAQIGSPMQHPDATHTAAFSNDGKIIITTDHGSSARLWSGADARAVGPYLEHKSIQDAALSPDGRTLVSVGQDRSVRIWDPYSGKQWFSPIQFDEMVIGVTFNPKGRTFLIWTGTMSMDPARARGRPTIIDLATGHKMATLATESELTQAMFTADGELIGTVSRDGTARVWSSSTGRPMTPPLRHRAPITNLSFNREGQMVLTASQDGTVKSWNSIGGAALDVVLAHPKSVEYAAYSKDSKFIATICQDQIARVWDANTGREILQLPHSAAILSLQWSSTNRELLTTSTEPMVRLWRLPAAIGPKRFKDSGQISSVALLSADKSKVVLKFGRTHLQLWDLASSQAISPPIDVDEAVENVAINEDASLIAGSVSDMNSRDEERTGVFTVWEARSGRVKLKAHTAGPINDIEFSSQQERLAVAGEPHTAEVWNLPSGRILTRVQQGRMMLKGAFSPDGNLLVTTSQDSSAQVWDARNGARVSPPLEYSFVVIQGEFSHDGRRVAAGSSDRTARVWDVRTGRPVTPWIQHTRKVDEVKFSPDDRVLATATSDDGTVHLWDSVTGLPTTPALINGSSLAFLAFNPAGTLIATADEAGMVRVWSTTTGDPIVIQQLRASGRATVGGFSADGRSLVLGTDGGEIFQLKIEPNREPVSRLALEAQMLSGRRLDKLGKLVWLNAKELKSIWDQLHFK